jgi:DNA-binding CsgD family transcriptional regulator
VQRSVVGSLMVRITLPGTMLSIDGTSALIGAIYDCAIAPEQWQSTLEQIRSAANFANAALGMNGLPSGEPTLFASTGIAPEWLALGRMHGYGEDTLELWGGPARIRQFPLDEPIVQSHVTDPAGWTTNRWATEWALPQGLGDAVTFVFARDATMVGNLTCGLRERVSEKDEAKLELLRFIAPHVRRAITISRLLDLKAIEASTLASAFESLAAAVVLVDASLAIVHANGAAGIMLSASDPIRSHRGQLQLTSAAAKAALQTAIAVAAQDESELGRRGLGIPLRRRDGSPCVAHVLPLRKGQHRPGLSMNVTAAVFIVPPSSPPRMPADALALLYDLTPAESRVFELIAEGQSQPDVARSLGIALSTVKTHLLHVFDKTKCRRQAELVRLAASMSLPL